MDVPHDEGPEHSFAWVSPNTLGQESTVTVTFEKRGTGTLMTLVHSDLPDDEKGRSREKGWNHFLGMFLDQFSSAPQA
ncbi:SRPBCC family protein [Edaphobacter sp.]|uniref:SRPBCC family protein n=1 Tax=Edaphobacter sp. TaxID=1934404 RepID=UPI0039C87775